MLRNTECSDIGNEPNRVYKHASQSGERTQAELILI